MRSDNAQNLMQMAEQALESCVTAPDEEMNGWLLASMVSTLGAIFITLEEIRDAIRELKS